MRRLGRWPGLGRLPEAQHQPWDTDFPEERPQALSQQEEGEEEEEHKP